MIYLKAAIIKESSCLWTRVTLAELHVFLFFFFLVYSIHIWCLFGNKKLARITTMWTMNIVDA